MTNTKFSGLQIGIILLILATALIHLWVGVPTFLRLGIPLLILNGLGYLALLGALYLPFTFLSPYRKQARWVLMGYAALTIVLYFIFQGGRAFRNPLGLVDKTIEIILLVLLWIEARQTG